MRDLRDAVYAHLRRNFFTGTRTGEIRSQTMSAASSVVTSTLTDTISNVGSTIIAMLILSWQLTLVAVARTRWVSPRKPKSRWPRAIKRRCRSLDHAGQTFRAPDHLANFHHHNSQGPGRQMIGHSFSPW